MSSGPPPSSFNHPSTSTSSASASKRHSVPASPSLGPRPLHLLDLAGSSISSPTTMSSPVLSPSPIGLTEGQSSSSFSGSRTTTPRSAKRQSAISYFSPDHESSREKEILLKRTSSPLHTTSFETVTTVPSRPGSGGIRPSVEALVPSKVVNVAAVEEKVQDVKDRPPVNSAEKHAELLHFIAQKEAKCLELRSQLAVHEEELLQLKRKWERIINRGLERENGLSFSPTNPNYPTNTKDIPAALMSLTTNPSLTLEGIKEGVQGMSRMLAAGLSISGPSDPSFQSNNHAPGSRANPKLGVPHLPLRQGSTSPIPPSPLSATSTTPDSEGRQRRRTAVRGSDSSNTTGTTRMSGGSSSVTSLEDEPNAADTVDRRSTEQKHVYNSPQELMVSDTGATPTVSPNPAFLEQNARRRKREQERKAGLDEDEVAWDAWGEVGEGETETNSKSSTPWLMDPPKTRSPTSPAPLAASIPTFGAATQSIAGLSALASPQVSSWMESMGKKLGGDLQKSTVSALSRSQKRASLMLSDMSQSFVSALTVPVDGQSPSSRSTSPVPPPLTSSPSTSSSTNGPATSKHTLTLSASLARNTTGSRAKTVSLLDDEDDDTDSDGFGPLVGSPQIATAGADASPNGMAIMKPDTVQGKTNGSSGKEDGFDEWNW